LDPEPALVHRAVVRLAQQHQIGQARLPALRPMLDVMRLDEALAAAAREPTAPVPRPQRPADRRRHHARLAPDAERLAVPIPYHPGVVAGAGELPTRRDWQPRAYLASAKGRLPDVHQHLVLTRPARPGAVLSAEVRLRERDERIGPLRKPALAGQRGIMGGSRRLVRT